MARSAVNKCLQEFFMKRNTLVAAALVALVAVGAFAQAESDFEVRKGSKSVTITKYVGKGGTVTIPPKIQNLPVTTIGDLAFQDNTVITSVTIPTSVTKIGMGAFANCTNLTSVTIGDGVTRYADKHKFRRRERPQGN
jgi:hypothetical protein